MYGEKKIHANIFCFVLFLWRQGLPPSVALADLELAM